MFAYCANNPVLYVDYSGRLFGVPSLADFGKIHKRIQYEIAEKEGYAIEVFVDGPRGRGFLDIYNPETNEYYEVKSILQADRKHTKMQMEKYDAAYIRDFRFSDYSIPNPPTRGEKKFSGSFVYSEWTVRYRLSEDGLITYKLELIEEVAAVQAIVAIGAVGISQSAAFAGSGGFGKGLFANTDFRLY